ncbi:MAG: hypothetical protein H0V09_01290, partial [Gemmatimonadetes bacterium]|nr:hypothetical protein [Gemmatimonadota bacterium]
MNSLEAVDLARAGSRPAAIGYQLGLAVLSGFEEGASGGGATIPPWMGWDPRLSAWVAAGHHMPELRAWAGARGIPERSDPPDRLVTYFNDAREPRELQREAVDRWRAGGAPARSCFPRGPARRSFKTRPGVAEIVALAERCVGKTISMILRFSICAEVDMERVTVTLPADLVR